MAPADAVDCLETCGKDQKIKVVEGNGFLYQLQLNQKLDYPPADVYSILVDPNAQNVFRSIKACTYRKVLQDDRRGRRQLQVAHRATVRFLFIAVNFETELMVWEDDHARTIKFQNAREGFMKKFDGSWHVQPFSQAAVRASQGGSAHPPRQHPFHWLADAAHRLSHHAPPTAAWVSLEQCLLPRTPAPPGVKHLIKSLCAKQIRDMMEDLSAELRRRKESREGKPARQHPPQKQQHPQPSGAACLTLAAAQAQQQQRRQWQQLWEAAAPLVTFTIKL